MQFDLLVFCNQRDGWLGGMNARKSAHTALCKFFRANSERKFANLFFSGGHNMKKVLCILVALGKEPYGEY